MQYLDGDAEKTYVLTTNYQSDVLGLRTRGQFIILLAYTKGSETGLDVKVEMSSVATGGNTTYFQTSEISGSGPGLSVANVTYQMTATGNYQVAIPTVLQMQRLRISVKGTGMAASGTVVVRVADDSAYGTDPKNLPTLTES